MDIFIGASSSPSEGLFIYFNIWRFWWEVKEGLLDVVLLSFIFLVVRIV